MPDLSYAIVFVSDMQRSVDFYCDVIGFPLRFQSDHWTELETGQTTIALHHTDVAATAACATDGSSAGTCQLGIAVDDLDGFHEHLLQHGVGCLSLPALQEFGGRLAKYVDPDGGRITVSERRSG